MRLTMVLALMDRSIAIFTSFHRNVETLHRGMTVHSGLLMGTEYYLIGVGTNFGLGGGAMKV